MENKLILIVLFICIFFIILFSPEETFICSELPPIKLKPIMVP